MPVVLGMILLAVLLVGPILGIIAFLRLRGLEQRIARGFEAAAEDRGRHGSRIRRLEKAVESSERAKTGTPATPPPDVDAIAPPAAADTSDTRPPVEETVEPRPVPVAPDVGERQRAAGPTPLEATEGEPESVPAGRLPGLDVEQLVGGAWLNRLGVLVTVIGVALGLGWSFTYLGAAGRIAIGFAAGTTMLGAGVVLERRASLEAWARGLIGGGWAAVYVTVYASHAIDAARVVDSPAVWTAMLLATAAAIVVHSLRYRSQTVTGTAFAVVVGTLAIVPLSGFSALAVVPVAAAMIWLARRFEWTGLSLLAVVSSYGIYMLSDGTLPRTGSFLGDFLAGQALLLVYWGVFELHGLLLRRDGAADPAMPLNAVGFIGVSAIQWSTRSPEMIGAFALLGSALFGLSSLLRERIGTAEEPGDDVDVQRVLVGGGSLIPSAVAAAMFAWALAERFSGLRLALAWIVEAQMLFFAGQRLGRRWLRGIAAGVFALAVAHLLDDPGRGGSIVVAAIDVEVWSLVALTLAALLVFDRVTAAPTLLIERGYDWVAGLFVVVVVALELPPAAVAPAWGVLALAAMIASGVIVAPGLRLQAYLLSVAAFARAFLVDLAVAGDPEPLRIAGVATVVAVLLTLHFLTRRAVESASGASTEAEETWHRIDRAAGAALAALAPLLLVALLADAVSGRMLTVAWAISGIAALGLGFGTADRGVRISGLAILGLCLVKLFAWDLAELEMPYRVLSFLVLGLLMLAASFAYARLTDRSDAGG